MRNNVHSRQGIINSVDKKVYINVIVLVTTIIDSCRLVIGPACIFSRSKKQYEIMTIRYNWWQGDRQC